MRHYGRLCENCQRRKNAPAGFWHPLGNVAVAWMISPDNAGLGWAGLPTRCPDRVPRGIAVAGVNGWLKMSPEPQRLRPWHPEASSRIAIEHTANPTAIPALPPSGLRPADGRKLIPSNWLGRLGDIAGESFGALAPHQLFKPDCPSLK
jgi:hypothetical protein